MQFRGQLEKEVQGAWKEINSYWEVKIRTDDLVICWFLVQLLGQNSKSWGNRPRKLRISSKSVAIEK